MPPLLSRDAGAHGRMATEHCLSRPRRRHVMLHHHHLAAAPFRRDIIIATLRKGRAASPIFSYNDDTGRQIIEEGVSFRRRRAII